MYKFCPLKAEKDDSCQNCHWNFGPEKCGIYTIAADISVIVEESTKQTKLLYELVQLLKK